MRNINFSYNNERKASQTFFHCFPRLHASIFIKINLVHFYAKIFLLQKKTKIYIRRLWKKISSAIYKDKDFTFDCVARSFMKFSILSRIEISRLDYLWMKACKENKDVMDALISLHSNYRVLKSEHVKIH